MFILTAQAGIAVVTREGEKTLTIQNAQDLKQKINAEKEAMRLAKAPREQDYEEEEVYQSHKQPAMILPDTTMEEE